MQGDGQKTFRLGSWPGTSFGLGWTQNNFSIPYLQRISLKQKILDSSPDTKNRFEIQIRFIAFVITFTKILTIKIMTSK